MKLKDILSHTKGKRHHLGDYCGRVYFKNGKIIYISINLFGDSWMCEIAESGSIKKELPINYTLLSWFRNQQCCY